MNILLIGSQGSGKGTQADLLCKSFNLYHLESGELLREAAKTDEKLNSIINKKGGLVPDDITFSVVTKKLNAEHPSRDGILFDGFPRSVAQYTLLKDWLGQLSKKVDLAVLIKISDDEAVRRLSARRICSQCGKIWNLVVHPRPPSPTKCDCGGELVLREDDKPEAIKERLTLFWKVTQPVIEALDSEGKLIQVGGERPIGIIYEEIVGRLPKE